MCTEPRLRGRGGLRGGCCPLLQPSPGLEGLQSFWLSPLAADEIGETVGKGFPGAHSRRMTTGLCRPHLAPLVPLVALRGQQ